MELARILEAYVPKVGLVNGIVYDRHMKRKGRLTYADKAVG